MTAYMLVSINMLEDESWRDDYREAVPAIIRRFGGEYHIRSSGAPIVGLEGDARVPDRVALISFPSVEAITEFMNSEAYKPYREARIASAFTNIIAFEGIQG